METQQEGREGTQLKCKERGAISVGRMIRMGKGTSTYDFCHKRGYPKALRGHCMLCLNCRTWRREMVQEFSKVCGHPMRVITRGRLTLISAFESMMGQKENVIVDSYRLAFISQSKSETCTLPLACRLHTEYVTATKNIQKTFTRN